MNNNEIKMIINEDNLYKEIVKKLDKEQVFNIELSLNAFLDEIAKSTDELEKALSNLEVITEFKKQL